MLELRRHPDNDAGGTYALSITIMNANPFAFRLQTGDCSNIE
jgi:hypothetical protein